MEISVEAITYNSKNPLKLAVFYQTAFDGTEIKEQVDGHLGLNIGTMYLGFDKTSDLNPSSSVTVWFKISDINTIYQKLLELGATRRDSPTKINETELIGTLFDPDGNTVGLIEVL